VLGRLAVDLTTRAYGSVAPLVRDLAKKLHDNHLPQDMPVRSLDIIAATERNKLLGRAKLILDAGYENLMADRNNLSLSREEFNRLVGSTLTDDRKLPATTANSPTTWRRPRGGTSLRCKMLCRSAT
jgi:hypothetical protein